MKTIEEKAKAYDEIIERAKTTLAAGEVMYGKENNASQLITDIIPELRESEDEKIRKGLIRHLEELRDWKIDAIPPIKVSSHYDAWIAYLEKQKEKSDYLSVNRVKVRPDGGTERYTIGYLEKQEQKPTWSEEDEKHINNILDIIDYWKATARFVSYQDGTAVDRDINWLKSLRPQPKQEWSEEDKKMLDDIIVFISGYADKRVVAEWVNFLKSLRPSWKPSEEQMKHLEYYVSTGSISLKSLYNDLKKL